VMRRETRWIGSTAVRTGLGAASTAAILQTYSATILALMPFTIVRTRGLLMVTSDQQAATEVFDIGYGHAVVSAQATAIGVTAVPTPVADDDSDLWFLYERVANLFDFTTGTGYRLTGIERQLDSKAMRKCEDGNDFIVAAETSALSNGATVFSYVRQLIKLH